MKLIVAKNVGKRYSFCYLSMFTGFFWLSFSVELLDHNEAMFQSYLTYLQSLYEGCHMCKRANSNLPSLLTQSVLGM